MKLLLYSHAFAPSVGGVQTIVSALARGLARRGVVVTLATPTPASGTDDSAFGFPVVRLAGSGQLFRLIRQADLVHVAGPATMPMLLGYLLRKPVVVEHHNYQAICPNGLLVYQPTQSVCPGHFLAGRHRECWRCNAGRGKVASFRMWILGFPRLWLCRRVDRNLAIAEHARRRAALPRQEVILHGVPVTDPAEGSLAGAEERGATVCFAYVGRFVEEKGLLVLIDAAAQLQHAALPFRLKLIGDGPERGKLEAAVKVRELGDRIEFTGMLGPARVREATEGVAAFVMPSLCEEVCPLAPIEQMMRGKALIVSDLGGLAEVAGDAGLKFPPGNAEALASRMRQAIENPRLAEELGRRGRARAERVFREEQMIDKHLALYEEVLARRAE